MKKLSKKVISKHQLATENIFGVFQKTLLKIKKEEEEIEKDINAEQEKIDEALEVKSSLEEVRNKISNFGKKISSFIED